MEPYKVPAGEGTAEFTEKKSRFIGRLYPMETEEAAIEKMKALRKQHWDASHNVWAYILHAGPVRFSDDGEPQGTAGMPVLEVLRREELSDVLCVVTRYFGGTLLGAGGLTRAYARAAKLSADAAGIAEMLPYAHLRLVCPYDLLDSVRRAMPLLSAEESGVEYGVEVMLEVLLPAAGRVPFETRIADLTSGRVKPDYLGEKMFAKRLR